MSRRRRKKWPFLLILVAALSGGGRWRYTNHHTDQDLGPENETTTVNRGEITKVVSATGELNPLVKVEIGSQISGTITTLNVDFNAKVKAGDILCQLDPATYEAFKAAYPNVEIVDANYASEEEAGAKLRAGGSDIVVQRKIATGDKVTFGTESAPMAELSRLYRSAFARAVA